MTGEYVEALAFLLLLPVLAFAALGDRASYPARPLGRPRPPSLAGVTYVAVTLATGHGGRCGRALRRPARRRPPHARRGE